MRIEEHTRPNEDPDSTFESGGLARAHVQYESLGRFVSDAGVETRLRGDFVEVPCKLAPAVRRRRLVS